MDAALAVLAATGAPPEAEAAAITFDERYTSRGRSPAHDWTEAVS
jgi:hypothetical protein